MRTFYSLLFGLMLVAAAYAQAPLPLSEFPRSKLQIATPDARLHQFDIWVAEDDLHREQGLMFIKNLPENAGMLFVYPSPRHIAMWMKNTFIPLDMVFIRADGRVANVVEKTTPLSTKIIESQEDVIAVLELKGGAAANLNIRKGAIVMHQFFGTGKS